VGAPEECESAASSLASTSWVCETHSTLVATSRMLYSVAPASIRSATTSRPTATASPRVVVTRTRGGGTPQRPPASAGATSARKRLSWPRWSQEVRRSEMWVSPAAAYSRSSAMHWAGLPATVQPSTKAGENLEV
jgi:hypothetical protein